MLEVFRVPFDELFEVDPDPAPGSPADFRAALADRYLIEREIGQGGMGTVFAARDIKLGRVVAIKVVSPEAVSGIGIKQFIKEIRYTARLQHHNILPVFDADEAAGFPYYVTPFIRNGSLRDRLSRVGRLSAEEVVSVTRCVADALEHAHDHQVLHCDIKPENILLSGDHAFVADFGISRAVHAEALEWGRRQEIDSSAGTPAYVSPEQASGESDLDARSDVYSLACMVFEMFTGYPPFTGTNTAQVVAQRFTTKVPQLSQHAVHVPPELAEAVAKAMSLQRQGRPGSAREFYDSLEDATKHLASRSRHKLAVTTTRLTASVRRFFGLAPSRSRGGGHRMFDSLKQDVGYAIRTLRRSPGFSVLVVLTLAFGIATNTLVFSLINPYFLRSLPYGDSDNIVQLGHLDPESGFDMARFSPSMFEDYRARSQAFDAMGMYRYSIGNVTGAGDPERVSYGVVTDNMFSVLQAPARIGRVFVDGEGGPGGANVVVIGHGLWQRRFGGDTEMVSKTLTLDGALYDVVGVMPQQFTFPFGGVDLWLPMRDDPTRIDRRRTSNELNLIHQDLAAQYPAADGEFSAIVVKPIREALNFVWDILRITFAILLAAVTFALVIACLNVASLSLARASARTSETAVRSALGASRGRIVQQLMTENILLAGVGGLVGVLFAFWGAPLLGSAIPEGLFRVGDVSVDGTVLLFTVLLTATTPLLFGLAPALAVSRANLMDTIKDGGRGGSSRKSLRARRALVVSEVALAVVLISGMGLMVRSFLAIKDVELGFDSESLLIVETSPPAADYADGSLLTAYYDRVTDRLKAIPGVQHVATTSVLPMNNELHSTQFARPDQRPAGLDDWPIAHQFSVSAGYFVAMDIPIDIGRDFAPSDNPNAPEVVAISGQLAQRYWPDGDAVGQPLMIGDARNPRTATVIAVVGDIKHESVAMPSQATVYRSIYRTQNRRRFVVTRNTTTPNALGEPVRQAMFEEDANLPVSVYPMSDIVGQGTLLWSIPSVALSVLGVASLLLAALGIYGVISYSVVQRSRDIGLRIALGATGAQVRRLFIGEGFKLGVVGLVFGIIIAVVTGQAMASLLFGVSPLDPLTLIGAFVVFLAVAVAASYLPALRASRVDPLEVLRSE